MDRRSFLLGGGALFLAGCARTVPTGPSPSPSPSAAATVLAVEQTPTGAVLGALLAGALSKFGITASVQAPPADLVGALSAGAVTAAPVWATSLWSDLSVDEDLPDDVLSELAGLVGAKVSTLSPGSTDGQLMWLTAASNGLKSWEDLSAWSVGKQAAVPPWAIDRTDGLGALNQIYRTSFAPAAQDDALARVAAVAGGQAGVGAFRRTEYLGVAPLSELIDPDQVCISDQLLLLANAGYTDAQPEQTLALNAVIQNLTNGELVGLEQQVAQGGVLADVTRAWLAARKLV